MSTAGINAYPLQWPLSRPRTPDDKRQWGTFRKYQSRISVYEATIRLQNGLDKLNVLQSVLSTNVPTRLDGFPRSDQKAPTDPGVALYFTLKGKPHCLPCDRYGDVAQNIAALAAHIEATRAIERYGVATLTDMFTGFTALPSNEKTWRDHLGFGPDKIPTQDDIRNRFRQLAQIHHPDKGGDAELFSQLCKARDEAISSCAHS